jgi:transcriptional regulator with XRE-family HTH domain
MICIVIPRNVAHISTLILYNVIAKRGVYLLFGERLKYFRKESNMSQKEMGKKLSVSSQAISKWENNQSEPEFQVIKRITELFCISYDELFLDVDNKSFTGLIKQFNKDTSIGKRYLFFELFLSFLTVSYIYIVSITAVNQKLTWHFPVGFGVLGIITLLFLIVVSNWYFNHKKLPNMLLSVYGDKVFLSELELAIPLEKIKTIATRKYNLSTEKAKVGKLIIHTTTGEKYIIRDINNIDDLKTVLNKFLIKQVFKNRNEGRNA